MTTLFQDDVENDPIDLHDHAGNAFLSIGAEVVYTARDLMASPGAGSEWTQ